MRTPAPRPDGSGATFAELGLAQRLVDALAANGITVPTPIQAAAIPDALSGRDVLGRAHTGSGKTLAFGLPLLTRLAGTSTRRRSDQPRALVLLPTRELAQQVETALRPHANALGLSMTTVIGGTAINRNVQALRRGVDVLIATPGRLLDLLDRRALNLDSIDIAVLDEADHMADLGFLPAVTRILDQMPPTRQCLLFSATLDSGVDTLVKRYLSDPAEHRVGDADRLAPDIDHRIITVAHADKVAVATELATRSERTLFFVRTKHGADRLTRQLRQAGVGATALHGNMNQNQRSRSLDAFSAGHSTVMVATDIAARGIHVDDLDLVVHYDPPNDAKVYAHRSGRTARAGAKGTVITLVEPHQHRDITRMHAKAGIQAATTGARPGRPPVERTSRPRRPRGR